MAYSDKVIDHMENPRNVGTLDKSDPQVGTGMVGAPACGDVMKLQLKINDDGIIEDAKFKPFGCGSATASTGSPSSAIVEPAAAHTLSKLAQADAGRFRSPRSRRRSTRMSASVSAAPHPATPSVSARSSPMTKSVRESRRPPGPRVMS